MRVWIALRHLGELENRRPRKKPGARPGSVVREGGGGLCGGLTSAPVQKRAFRPQALWGRCAKAWLTAHCYRGGMDLDRIDYTCLGIAIMAVVGYGVLLYLLS